MTGWVAGEELRVSTFITAQNNPLPGEKLQSYEFLLHEDGSQGWQPQLYIRDTRLLLQSWRGFY